ncbi:coproporphyrinogen III oxidase [Stenotrophomonas sp. YIM B06876]|uniref:coproporphyrinogen III oxidase n=1 Tax=Stenotrophomonas sp. YIM B06876 TaxID=3060211 RepID=UPI0027394218|nr:coproporphyrinogen III oxidase [Stenotrophomonas sp. YIM B06876]
MDTTPRISRPPVVPGGLAAAGGWALHPQPQQYMAGFGDAAFRRAATISNGHLIPRSLTLSFATPGTAVVAGVAADAYLHALMLALRRTTELFDEDREVMHVVLAQGLAEYLGLRNLGDLLDAVPRYLRTTALPEVAVTITPGSPLVPAQLVAAGCSRCILVDDRGGAEPEFGSAWADAGFQLTEYRLDVGLSCADRPALARIERALAWQPDQLRLPWPGPEPDGTAPAVAGGCAVAATLERHGYVAGGADTYVRHAAVPLRAVPPGARYCDLHGLLRAERTDLVGVGPGAASQVGDVYCQFGGDYPRWHAALERGHLHVARGLILSAWESMVAETLQSLACDYALDTVAMESRHGSLFLQLRHAARLRLQRVLDDGLAVWERKTLRLTPRGKPLWRGVADCFGSPDVAAPGLEM